MATVSGTANDDTLLGTSGDDVIAGGDGSDIILGRAGDDTITLSGKSGSWADTIDGGDGTDRVVIDLDGIHSLLTFSRSAYQTDSESFTLTDAIGNSITLTSIEEVEIAGTVYSTQVQDHEGQLIDLENVVYLGMRLSGDTEDGVFFTDDSAPMGSDLVYPTAPRDSNGNTIADFRFYGTSLDDVFQTVQQADGNSFIKALAGDDYLDSGLGADTLLGGSGDDIFRVDDAGDRIEGGTGNDSVSLYLRTSNGTLSTLFTKLDGGAGTDSLAVNYRASVSTKHLSLEDPFISSFENISVSAYDADFISVRGSAAANEITVSGLGSYFAHGGDGDDTLTASGYEISATLLGGDGDDVMTANEQGITLWGGDGNDLITSQKDGGTLGGGTGNDTLDGDYSDNTLYGGAGDDVIKAGNGNDLIFGGQGNDVITTRYGNNTIWGGAGDDTVELTPSTGWQQDLWFSSDHGDDVIRNFDATDDILHLGGTIAGFTSVAAVVAASTAASIGGEAGILIDTGGGNSIFLEGVTAADLSASNLAFD